MLIFMTVFPVAMAIALRSTLYDGLRHFLFLMPVLAVLSGWGFSAAWDGLQVGWPRLALMGTALRLIAWVLVDMVQLHPYQSLYYNRVLAGGLRGAAGRFETDYWGQSYKEATEWVMANYRPSTSQPIRVANCSISFLSEYFLEKEPAPRRFVGRIWNRPTSLWPPHGTAATTARDDCSKSLSVRELALYTCSSFAGPFRSHDTGERAPSPRGRADMKLPAVPRYLARS